MRAILRHRDPACRWMNSARLAPRDGDYVMDNEFLRPKTRHNVAGRIQNITSRHYFECNDDYRNRMKNVLVFQNIINVLIANIPF